jgi:hypothetical protein
MRLFWRLWAACRLMRHLPYLCIGATTAVFSLEKSAWIS